MDIYNRKEKSRPQKHINCLTNEYILDTKMSKVYFKFTNATKKKLWKASTTVSLKSNNFSLNLM